MFLDQVVGACVEAPARYEVTFCSCGCCFHTSTMAATIAFPPTAAPSDGQTKDDTITCCTCRGSFQMTEVTPANSIAGDVKCYRCKCCNNAKGRIHQAIKKHPEIEDAFENAKGIGKEDVVAKCRDMYGDDLVATLRHTYTVSVESEKRVKMVGTGSYLDLEDLTDKYTSKPSRLQAILKNTHKFWDDVSEVYLYEDMAYQSTMTEEVSSRMTKETIMDDINAEKIKPPRAKKPKLAKIVNSDDTLLEETPKRKPLTEKQKAVIAKMILDLNKMGENIGEALKPLQAPDASEWRDYVPAYVANKTTVALATKDALIASLQIAIENEDGCMKELIKSVADCKIILKEGVRMATLQIQEAQSMA